MCLWGSNVTENFWVNTRINAKTSHIKAKSNELIKLNCCVYMDVVLWYTVMVADEIRQYFILLSRHRGHIKRINCLNTKFQQKIQFVSCWDMLFTFSNDIMPNCVVRIVWKRMNFLKNENTKWIELTRSVCKLRSMSWWFDYRLFNSTA